MNQNYWLRNTQTFDATVCILRDSFDPTSLHGRQDRSMNHEVHSLTYLDVISDRI
jgi:hypothetical protein